MLIEKILDYTYLSLPGIYINVNTFLKKRNILHFEVRLVNNLIDISHSLITNFFLLKIEGSIKSYEDIFLSIIDFPTICLVFLKSYDTSITYKMYLNMISRD